MRLLTPNIQKLVKEGDYDSLLKCLTHKKAEIRIKAFLALYEKAKIDEKILKSIKALVNDPEPKVKIDATLKLAELGLKDIMESMKYVTINGSKSEKIELLRILTNRYKARDESVSNLLVLAMNDKTALIQIEAIKTMGLMKDTTAVFHLAEKLHDRRHAMRIESIRALGLIATPNAIDLIIGSLMDKNADVRKAARDALESVGTERALKAISDAPFLLLVKKMNSNVTAKIETIIHISKQKITEGLPLIRKACSDEYKNVRIEAIKALALMKDKGALSVLAKCIEDPYYDVRLETVRTLEKLTTKESLLLAEKAIKDYNHNVREEAKRVYYHLLDRLEKLENKAKNEE